MQEEEVDAGAVRQQHVAVIVSAKAGKAGAEFPYPLVHQFGSKTVPARPFIPVQDDKFSPAAEKEILADIDKELDRLIRRTG